MEQSVTLAQGNVRLERKRENEPNCSKDHEAQRGFWEVNSNPFSLKDSVKRSSASSLNAANLKSRLACREKARQSVVERDLEGERTN